MHRGACPTVNEPLRTGDGLLMRLSVCEPMNLTDFITFCERAERLGNGIIEVTQRGSLQIRGLSPSTAQDLQQLIVSLNLNTAVPTIVTPALCGLDASESPVAASAARTIINALAELNLRACGPKFSIVVDTDGAGHLDELSADLRLRIAPEGRVHIGVGGRQGTSDALGWVEVSDVTAVVREVLVCLADLKPAMTLRPLAASSVRELLQARLGHVLQNAPAPAPREAHEPLGYHALCDASHACGIGLAFGYCEAAALIKIARAARELGARSARPALHRTLMFIGLSLEAACALTQRALEVGFIVEPADPRRRVVACPGAPACASATIPTRSLASAVTLAARTLLAQSAVVHLSGCPKGCAHSGEAAVTFVGPGSLVIGGRASDRALAQLSAASFLRLLEQLDEGQAHDLVSNGASSPVAVELARDHPIPRRLRTDVLHHRDLESQL